MLRKWGKLAHTNLGTPETWILRLDKNAFSGLKNELNFNILCDGSQISKNRVFREPKCLKFAHTKPGTCGKFPHTNLGTLHTWISRKWKIAFSDLKNGKISTLQEVPWNVEFTNRQKSHFHTVKMQKICSYEPCYPWNPWNEFSGLKNEENFTLFARYHGTLVSRIGRNCIFRLPKCGKVGYTKLGICGKLAHTKVGTQETWISRIGKIAFWEVPSSVGFTKRQKSNFHAPKCGKFAHSNLVTFGKFSHTKLGTLKTCISRLVKIAF